MSILYSTISLVLGLYLLRGKLVFSIILSLIYIIFLFTRFGKKRACLYIAIFTLGVFIPLISTPVFEGNQTITGMVIEAKENYVILESRFNKYFVSIKDNDYEMLDVIQVDGYLTPLKFTTYESQFNFEEYLANKGINYELKVKEIDSKYSSFLKIKRFKKSFLSKFDADTATLIKAFLFNEKDFSQDLIKLADKSGVLYLLSLSGVYLQTLFKVLNYVLFLRFSKKESRILTFIILLPFALFSILKIGTIRVFSLYLFKYVNEFYLNKRFSHVELVSILALFFIAIDYHLVYQEAFYIGFLLSILVPFMHNAVKIFKKPLRGIAMFILLRLILLSLQVNSGYLDILYIIKGVLPLPLNFAFLILSMASVVLPFYSITNTLGKAEIWMIEKMGFLTFKIPFATWGGTIAFTLIAVFCLVIYFLESGRLRHLQKLSILFLIMFLFSIVPLQEPLTNVIYFVNVGQGDSIIIKNRNKTVMIDTGGYKSFDMASETLIPFMNKNKITHIDALITSHDDFDHSGAKDSLIYNFKVKNYLNSKEDFPYKVGDLELINLNNFDFDSDNDSSLVLYLEFMNKRWLFTGDASIEVEKEIIKYYPDLKVDILKVGHHGSKTSTSSEFIKHIEPQEAIISCGANNFYGHPNIEVLDILNKYNVKIRRTDLEGTISYISLFN